MTTDPSLIQENLKKLRKKLRSLDLDGFLVPLTDAYFNEHVLKRDRQLEFLTGFTGSAGFLIITQEKAAFFTDSRYTIQAKNEIPTDCFIQYDIMKQSPFAWLIENKEHGTKIGFDPDLHRAGFITKHKEDLQKQGINLIPTSPNPINEIWTNRPEKETTLASPHDKKYAGKTHQEKRLEISDVLKEKNLDAFIITDCTSIAWLLNIRGQDIPQTPIALSFAILKQDASLDWFIDQNKITPELLDHLGEDIYIFDEETFPKALQELGQQKLNIGIEEDKTSYAIVEELRQAGAAIKNIDDPCELPKACKNKIELNGARAAHQRDGVALTRFLAWIDQQTQAGKSITEQDAEKQLATYRSEEKLFKGLSFDTIAGAGEHAAIVHYKSNDETNREIPNNSLFLVDSGGQYLDGTTDVTRTIIIGTATQEMKDRFTRVLKGHIALASIHFPEGTTGSECDVLARQFLWEVGLDYGHGTGHGVGSYLNVHEGPQAISKGSKVKLREGMILSNEPGYYKEGAYGIRHENLQAVIPAPIGQNDQKMLAFEPLTLAPFDTRGLDMSLLTKTEITWINTYHQHVADTLLPHLDPLTAAWLKTATRSLKL